MRIFRLYIYIISLFIIILIVFNLSFNTIIDNSKSVTLSVNGSISDINGKNTCNDLLVIVNKKFSLPSTYTPTYLVMLKKYNIPVMSNDLQGSIDMVGDLKKLINDANKVGINISALSTYRSYRSQEEVYNGYVSSVGVNEANTFSALPGHSQHQLGLAIDFTTDEMSNSIGQSFSDTKAGKWLDKNANTYGFFLSYPNGYEDITGYEYEPWHYRYIGEENISLINNSKDILEKFLNKYGSIPNC